MNFSLDGTDSLADQESAIQFKEAQGYQLTTMYVSPDGPRTNVVECDELPPGQHPKRIHFTAGPLPAGKVQVWAGKIYVSSALNDVIAFRD